VAERRGWAEDSIYWSEQRRRWVGVISLGYGPDGMRRRRQVSGRTKRDVQDKLKALHEELDAGVKPKAGYTVDKAVTDWLAKGLSGRSPRTVAMNRHILQPVLAQIGRKPLRQLTAADVYAALETAAETRSTRTVVLTHNALERAIRHAEANDLVSRNVASLVTPPPGKEGRPSKSLTADEAAAVLQAARRYRIHAYVVLCLLTGIRTEEARALRWDHLDLEAGTGAVWRSVRSHGDVKTERSRRTLGLPQAVVTALRAHKERQDAERQLAESMWTEHGLVFATQLGGPVDAGNTRRAFRAICRAAGIGENWSPRELRTSFVSLMSHRGVSTEEIARLVGHSSTRTTEVIYRRELRPVINTGATIMDRLFPDSDPIPASGNTSAARRPS
jgi:integrase